MTLGLVYGVWYAYSVFLVALLREFGWSRSVVAGAFSVFTLVHGGLGPPLGWLADRLGPRPLVLLGGAVTGAGLFVASGVTEPWQLYAGFGGLAAAGVALAGWVPAVILLQRWFPERMGTAVGFASAGIGVGIFLVVPLCQWLIEQVGWRWAWRTLGLLVAGWVIPATLWLLAEAPRAHPSPFGPEERGPSPVPPTDAPGASGPPPAGDRAGGSEDISLAGALGTLRFWLLWALQFCVAFANQMLLVHHAAYLVDHGIPALTAAAVVGLVGIASVVGKVGGGWVSDHAGRRLTYTVGTALGAASIGVLALLALFPAPVWPWLYGVIIGIGYAIPAAVTPALISDAFPGRHFGRIFGALVLSNSLGGSAGPWVAGRIFDATGSYAPAFAGAVVSLALGTAALWGTRRPGAR